MSRIHLWLGPLWFLSLIPPASQETHSRAPAVRDLILAMQARHRAAIAETYQVRQRAINFQPDGRKTEEELMESFKVPGHLRVDYLPLPARKTEYFINDRMWIKEGEGLRIVPVRNIAQFVFLDLYRLPVEDALRVLTVEAFNLNVVHEERISGKRIIVVGAEKGDREANQIWIDAHTLLPERVAKTYVNPQGSVHIETRFSDFRKVTDQFWFPMRLEFFRNGVKVTEERATTVRANLPLSEEFFVPR